MKRLFLLLGLALTLAFPSCDNKPQELAQGNWDPQIHSNLNNLMASYRNTGAYAVFDFDKTSIVHDVSQALWVYQIEHLRFSEAPAHAFLDGIPDVTRPLGDITFAEMGKTLQEEYSQMAALKAEGKTLEQIHETDTYKDFRARMAFLLAEMDEVFRHEVSYLWMPGLLAGFTEADARQVVREALADQLGEDKLEVQEWTSPDGRWSAPVERGIWLSPEMKDLYRCLTSQGITPYVCSASLKLIVEELACDPKLGLGLPPEQVFGLRFVPGATLAARFDPSIPQPIKQGKVTCILTQIAPRHGNREPVLVGGDSNGDVPMLTAFGETVYALIIDVGRSPESKIGQLARQAREMDNKGRFLLQPNFATIPGEVEGGGI